VSTNSTAPVYYMKLFVNAMLCYVKTSRLGRRKCQSTTRAPNNVVSVKSTIK